MQQLFSFYVNDESYKSNNVIARYLLITKPLVTLSHWQVTPLFKWCFALCYFICYVQYACILIIHTYISFDILLLNDTCFFVAIVI